MAVLIKMVFLALIMDPDIVLHPNPVMTEILMQLLSAVFVEVETPVSTATSFNEIVTVGYIHSAKI